MKLLFLLVFAPLCLAHCPPNHFKDDVFKKCTKCTPCHVVLTPCTEVKDAVCSSFTDKVNHHFQKNRIHFFDDAVDDSFDQDFHESDLLPSPKDHHKKNGKHFKSKHEEKHHYKKKHYEFDDDNDDYNYDNYNDEFDFNFEKVDKPKKHKKHFEFKKQKHYNKKIEDFLPSDEDLDDNEDFIFGKNFNKNKKKSTHPKKIDVNEEELKELLLQSQKKLKIRKDNFLKTLKDEKFSEKSNKVRLNSPVFDTYIKESFEKDHKHKDMKANKNSESDALKALADLNENDDYGDDDNDNDDDYDDDDDDDDFNSFLSSHEESYKPVPPHVKVNKKQSPSEVVGQGKEVDAILRSEMGKNKIFEQPHIKVLMPSVVGKDFHEEQKNYSPKYSHSKLITSDKEAEENREIETNEVVSLPFTAAETLVWDWQAVAVASAVASCLVFFLVVAIYFIVNTRHWKKVNKSYNKELDEISTRIALMQPMLEMGAPDSRSCLYMENIICPMKDEEKKGDVKV